MAKKKKKKVKSKARKKVKKAKKKAGKIKKAKKVRKVKKIKKIKKKKAAQVSSVPAMPWRVPLAGESFIGMIEDYFSHVSVCALTLKGTVNVGDTLHVRGHTTDLIQKVYSMQIEHQVVQSGNKGDSIGIKVDQRVRKGDYIYKRK